MTKTEEDGIQECSCCKDEMEKQQLPPRVLIAIGITSKRKKLVKVCPECDGGVISLSNRS